MTFSLLLSFHGPCHLYSILFDMPASYPFLLSVDLIVPPLPSLSPSVLLASPFYWLTPSCHVYRFRLPFLYLGLHLGHLFYFYGYCCHHIHAVITHNVWRKMLMILAVDYFN